MQINTRGSLEELESFCEPQPQASGFTQRLSSSPKLPQVFASGYINTASILYFFYKIYNKDVYVNTLAVFTQPDANIAGNQSERALYNLYFITSSDN